MGFLEDVHIYDMGKAAFHGGPLGELVQWSDLISSLFVLGHDLTISVQASNVIKILNQDKLCPSQGDPDLVYTDILGLTSLGFRKKEAPCARYRCKLRVLDSFGTDAQFNHPASEEPRNVWGKWGLNLRQFLTMYPHTPDNSFLGFVVGEHPDVSRIPTDRKNTALIYAKMKAFLQGEILQFLDVLHEIFEVHGTIADYNQTGDGDDQQNEEKTGVPSYIINHGLLNQTELRKLLQNTKVFVGLGFPYEGPAPLEAIANGVIYLQPKFDPPKDRDNDGFFRHKPTRRKVTSQNPYVEEFIGRPHAFTFDYGNTTEALEILRKIAASRKVQAFVPYEFTYEGMLERVSFLVQNLDICTGRQWPAIQHLRGSLSGKGQSCKHACHKKGFYCEPSFYHFINHNHTIRRLFPNLCQAFKEQSNYTHPAFDNSMKTCFLQTDNLKISCIEESPDLQRFCPCSSYRMTRTTPEAQNTGLHSAEVT